MNSLSIVLVIAFAFVGYSLAAPENIAVPPGVATPNCSPTPQNQDAFVEGYEVGYGKLNANGQTDDVTMKFHIGHQNPNDPAKFFLPIREIICAGKCAYKCVEAKDSSVCLSCLASCVIG